MPEVSVIIPVYNESSYLREAIDSVLAQTYTDYELLVVDDGSTDETYEIVKSYGKRLRSFRKLNGGVSSALNLGIRESSGRWIAWLRPDDMFLREKLERQVGCLRRNHECRVCYTDVYVIDTAGDIIDAPDTPRYPRASSLLVDRECFETVGLFDETLRHRPDLHMWLRLLRNFDIQFLPRRLVKIRSHPAQASDTSEAMRVEERMVFSCFCHELLGGDPVPSSLIECGKSLLSHGQLDGARSMLARALAIRPFEWSAAAFWLITWLGRENIFRLQRLGRKYSSAKRARFR
jgi:Glycosyl transferase family 2